MSLPMKLAEHTLARIREHLALHEEEVTQLTSARGGAPVGSLRVLRGERVARVVAVALTVPPIKLDSHMIFAFAPETSATPHFTLDAVATAEFHAYHLDLLPRVDLAASLPYLDAVMSPLTPTFEAWQRTPGLSPAQLSPRQRALMSPWMLAHRATQDAFARLHGAVTPYLDHWLALVASDAADAATTAAPGALAARDRLVRAAIFDPEVDPVWAQVDRLVGVEASARIRAVLRDGAAT